MTWLEIIHLRSSVEPRRSLEKLIAASIRGEGEAGAEITLYRRQGLDTDLAVHIHRPATAGAPSPSTVGLRLAAALRAYGLVEHTLWEESR